MDQGGVTVRAPVSAIAALATAPVQSVAGRTGAVTLAIADVSGAVSSSDSRLSDSREWSAATATQAEAEAGTGTSRLAFTPQRVFQGIAAWWAASPAKTKLDGVASGATANSSDATLLARVNHTGTQTASTITGLATVATTGAYADLSGRPTAFDPASPGAIGGTSAAAATFTSLTATGRVIKSVNGAASAPPVSLTGTWFTGGTSTTTKPLFLVEPDGTTSAAWSTAGTGIGVNASSSFIGNLLDLQVNGVSYLVIGKNKIAIGRNANYILFAGGTDTSETPTGACGNGAFRISYNGYYAWSSGADPSGTLDLRLYRDSANTLAQRNGTSGQVSRTYRTYADASNYERVGLDVSSNTFTFGPQAAGTGTLRPLYISTGSITVASLASAATVGAGSRAFVTDATATTFLSTVTGGGSNKVPVVSDGTNWLIG